MRLTQKQIYALTAGVGLEKAKTMTAIAMAESSGETTRVNSIGCVGLWQINQPVWVKHHPSWTVAWLKNPINNAIAAKAVLKQQGLSAWEAYTNGAYKKYMDADVSNANITPKDVGMSQSQFTNALKGQGGLLEDNPSTVDDVTSTVEGATAAASKAAEVATAAWEAITNPTFWLRLGYGVTGVVLIAGGLFLITKNTVVSQTVGQVTKAAGLTAKAKKG